MSAPPFASLVAHGDYGALYEISGSSSPWIGLFIKTTGTGPSSLSAEDAVMGTSLPGPRIFVLAPTAPGAKQLSFLETMSTLVADAKLGACLYR